MGEHAIIKKILNKIKIFVDKLGKKIYDIMEGLIEKIIIIDIP